MNIYEIEQAILDLIDPETGEITDFETLEALDMAWTDKIEGLALWIKNLNAEAKAIREEEKALAERRRVAENKADSLKKYLSRALDGERFTTAKVAISFRKSTAVEILDEDKFIADLVAQGRDAFLNYKAPTVNKTAVSEALRLGGELAGASLITRQNMQIK